MSSLAIRRRMKHQNERCGLGKPPAFLQAVFRGRLVKGTLAQYPYQQFHGTAPPEKLSRRFRVMGRFPADNSAMMLVCAWLHHVADIQFSFFPTVSTKYPSAPEISVPVFVLQIRVPVENHQRAFALERSHELCYTHVRWNTHQKMNVIRVCLSLDDLYFQLFAQLLDAFDNVSA